MAESKAGNSRLRKTVVQLAWLWLRQQPGGDLSRWFHQRVGVQIRRESIGETTLRWEQPFLA
jgi:transposase